MPSHLLGNWVANDGDRIIVHDKQIVHIFNNQKYTSTVSKTEVVQRKLYITFPDSDGIDIWELGTDEFTILDGVSKSDKNKVYKAFPPQQTFKRSHESEEAITGHKFTSAEWVRMTEEFEKEAFRDPEIRRYVDYFDTKVDLGRSALLVIPKPEFSELGRSGRTEVAERILSKLRASKYFADGDMAPWIVVQEGYPYTSGRSAESRIGNVPTRIK
jgi:hypothetical protein